ncbi:hypothetical protein SmaMPs15_000085 [Stenotrophomonas maltophilia phage vB_SmaM_Ps15]|uniref:Uncharacterized protein n=1 Tax=Stenotrophomonas maltophilia phage vB_SmaM_Ps15 TaxID=3071007 RepID=A0AAE9JV88_9CAUD|nr:hypothetical protein PQC01_gp085 [Stenotrophomonas maltophilia phage vB_SmaM_Ps15]UMO77236.1 hypothetical protein SmaMPs15_000085 [Stenotrophomonas maltophilia phage vB_SmaM_Ps15]
MYDRVYHEHYVEQDLRDKERRRLMASNLLSDFVIVDAGAFQLALNVLERAGKFDIVSVLKDTSFKLDDPYAATIRDALAQDIYHIDKQDPENML